MSPDREKELKVVLDQADSLRKRIENLRYIAGRVRGDASKIVRLSDLNSGRPLCDVTERTLADLMVGIGLECEELEREYAVLGEDDSESPT